jgi:LytS/YehU family sensor histidine kinase
VYRHLVLILLIAAVLYNAKEVFVRPFSAYFRLAALTIILSLFYLNMYRLVPKLLFKNKYTEYGLSILALAVVVLTFFVAGKNLLQPYFNQRYVTEHGNLNIYAFIFGFIVFTAASAAVKLFQRWVTDTQRINELEKTTMKIELEQLKNQVNPHFLFNMLNNTNVLIHKDPEKASQVLMKLSDLLRYQLYDSARSKVLLTADIHFITDFLNLEKIRRDNFEFIVSKEGEISGVQIPPLLFIVFVENAVKHNMDPEKRSYVHVYFEIQDTRLFFTCINSKPRIPAVKSSTGGLGLANARRILQLLYPGEKHTLDIQDEPGTYTVNLAFTL